MRIDPPRLSPRGHVIGSVLGYTTMVIGILMMGLGGYSLLRGSLIDPSAETTETADAAPAQPASSTPAQASEESPATPATGDGTDAEVASDDSREEEADQGFDHEFVIRTIPQQLRYDTTQITVKAGSRVRLTFDNNDILQHNLIVIQPGTQDEVGLAAQEMMSDPQNAIAEGYVPESDAILHHTRMLNGGEKQTLEFTAPENPDTYHYICTFPGHYVLMRGDLVVE